MYLALFDRGRHTHEAAVDTISGGNGPRSDARATRTLLPLLTLFGIRRRVL